MFRHYLVTALRNLARHKLYSFINIAGLSVGLACAILIVLFLRDELSYDRWIPDSENLYRVEMTFHMPGRPPWPFATAPFPLPRGMHEHIPEVKAMTRMAPEPMTVTVADRQFAESVMVVDPNFFRVLKLPLVRGDSLQVFAQPESIVLSERAARKYFGSAEPLGKTVKVSGADCQDGNCLVAVHLLTVTGVMRNLPHDTHLAADIFLPNSSAADQMQRSVKEQGWVSTAGVFGYVLLAPGADPASVLAKTAAMLDRTVSPRMLGGTRASELEQIRLTPLWDTHLTSDAYGGMKPSGSWATVYGFAIIATLILLVACFNFMNLATAQSTLRAREISLRKAVGAKRSQLIVQLLGESLLTALVSLVLALALVEILTPAYDSFLQRPIKIHYAFANGSLFAWMLAGTILVGLLSGAYPAFLLSHARAAAAARPIGPVGTSSGKLRMALVIFQFAVSIGLGITAIVVSSQINFIRTIDLGFNDERILIVRGANNLTTTARDSFARALQVNPGIVSTSLSNAVPFDFEHCPNILVGAEGETQQFASHLVKMSPGFPATYGMRLLAGRQLSAQRGGDLNSGNALINAEAARRFGYKPQQAIGRSIPIGDGTVQIVGVLADSRMDGPKTATLPAIYIYGQHTVFFSIRMRGRRIGETLDFIDRTWLSFAPNAAIQRYFLSDAFDDQMRPDDRQGAIFFLFVGVAISIACLGLFGLAAFTSQRRTKEIGVRKVFGASTIDIVRLLLWQFSIPVLIANIIAWPIAYYYLNHWLQSYADRIALGPHYFLIAALGALLIAWMTAGGHALRVALANPIHALRHE